MKTKKITLINTTFLLVLGIIDLFLLMVVIYEATTPPYWPMLKYTFPTMNFLTLIVNLCLLSNMNKRRINNVK